MKIVFLSLTGNVRDFVKKAVDNMADTVEISYQEPYVKIDTDYILIVPSYDEDTTNVMCEFINFKDNEKHLVGVVGSGSKNYADEYCFSAKDISKKYNKPLIFDFEFSGTEQDVERFKKEVANIEVSRVKQKD